MNKRMHRLSPVFTAILCLMMISYSSTVVDAAKKYDLPSSIKSTTIDYAERTSCGQTIRYETNRITWNHKYKYDKYGHLVSDDDGYGQLMRYKWKYKNKKILQMTVGKKTNSSFDKKSYNKKGRLKRVTCSWYDGKGKRTLTSEKVYTYNKKGWINKCVTKYPSGINNPGGSKDTATFRYTFHKNGFPKTITETNKYRRSTVKVNSKGLITSNGNKNYKYKYTYDKKGRVNKCIIQTINENSGKVVCEEYIYYKYSKYRTSDKKAYFAALNNYPSLAGAYIDDATVNR